MYDVNTGKLKDLGVAVSSPAPVPPPESGLDKWLDYESLSNFD
jgi:hypothetical protein